MSDRPKSLPPQTATKAHAAALAVLAASFLAQLGIGDAPDPGEVSGALVGLWSYAQDALVSAVLGAVAWVTTYVTRNAPK